MPEQLRIVHAADFHLGSPFSALSPRKAAIRQAEQEAAFHTVIELCRTENTRLLLLAGDLLDHQRIPAGMAEALEKWNLKLYRRVLPRISEIIKMIDRRMPTQCTFR